MTAPVWLRLTDTSGRGVLLRVEGVRAVYDIGNGRRRVEYGSGPDDHTITTDTLDAIAAALGAPVPSVAVSA